MSAERDMREHRPSVAELAAYCAAQAKRSDLPVEVTSRLAGLAMACWMADVPRERRQEGGSG